MSGGGGYERDVDTDSGESGWSEERYRGGGKTEKEFEGSHGGHWTETTYRNGTTYREHDDGTVEKRR